MRDGSQRITSAGDGGHRDEYGVCPCMQVDRSRPRCILESLMEDIECAGPQTDRVQERPGESSQCSSERVCSSTTIDEIGEQLKVSCSRKRHDGNAAQRVIGLTKVLKDALDANIKQSIEPNTPLMTFIVIHATRDDHEQRNTCVRGEDAGSW